MSRHALALALALAMTLPGGASAIAGSRVLSGAPVIRLHIVANSDKPQDIAAKLAVRDALWGYLQSRIADARSADEQIRELEALVPALGRIANRTLQGYGVPYRAQVAIGEADVPSRDYLGEKLPGGRYVTLLVRLGAARGQNWWCVLFPQLCFADQGASLAYGEGAAASPTEFQALGSAGLPTPPIPVRPGGLIWSFWQFFHSERPARLPR